MTKLTRRTFSLAAAGFAAAGLAGAHRAAFAQGPVDLSDVTLRVGDQMGATRARFEAAGLLDDVPYEIDWSVHAAAVNLHEALKADAVDIGSAADSPTVSAIAGGSKIKVVAAWTNGGKGSYLLVPGDSEIQTLADLEGRTICPTTRGSIAHYLVLGALKKGGLGASDAKLAFLTPADATAAFAAESVDAWATWGTYAARTIGAGARVLTDGQGINSGLSVLSATDSALADPAKVAAIADFALRTERSFVWSREQKADWIAFYSDFTRQDEAIVELTFDGETSYTRLAPDDGLAAILQTTYATWVEARVLPDAGLNLSDFVYRGIEA
ncbi:ABC transporter substrate-binding protein [Marinivivus vitaminiproducens]|uniref:ABC transporter substrate-binding protein n=1 Tax=Marinivivus vitaminiproducens TaxID=3035935 RepID=UPI00279C854A|nr:ABC transporter substrate-binding protein [Geminicoccaceae bacterium SCSIO 64248]